MARFKNPQYPHTCVIYRVTGSQFGDTVTETLYSGECRKEANTSIRNFYSEGVPKADYRVSIPGYVVDVLPGDMMDLTDRSRTTAGITLTDVNVSNAGTEVFFNVAKN